MAALSLGVAIGAGHLTAVPRPGVATQWTTQLTIAPHVAPEAGLPDENQRVRADGMVFTGFVERVGDPVPIAGPGGQRFAAEQLTVDAVKSLVKAQLAAFDGPPPLVIACPAYWTEAAREQFAAAASAARLPQPLRVDIDLAMAFARLRQLPDIPRTGLIALADLGTTGTTVGIGDAATGKLVGERIRLDEPNGTDLDHALLQHILAQVADPADLASSDPNLVAALEQLRVAVRGAKERLSADPVTSFAVDLPMYRGEVRVTRSELDDLAAEPIAGITTGLRELIDRGGASPSDLTAVALCGGGAAMPLVTQRLSADFHTAVFVDDEPYATAARGAAGIASTLATRPARPVGPPGPPASSSGPSSGPTGRDRRPPMTAGAAAAAAAAAAGTAGAAAANDRVPDRTSTPPIGIPTGPHAGTTARWQVHPDTPQSGDVPVGPRQRNGDAVTFAPRDDEPPTEPPRSKARLLLIVAAGAAVFLVAAGGVAYALTADHEPTVPAPGTSVSQFTKPSTTSSVEQTTEVVPTQEQAPPDNGDPNTWTTEPSEPSGTDWSSPDPGGSVPSVVVPTGGNGGGNGGTDGGGGITTPPPAS